MKHVILLCFLFLTPLLLFTACAQHTYQQYMSALNYLKEVDSFAVQTKGTVTTSEDLYGTVEVIHTDVIFTYNVVHSGQGYFATASMVAKTDEESDMIVNVYYKDGWQYTQDVLAQTTYRIPYEEDFVLKIALNGMLDFPQNVIQSQKQESTPGGTLLTFELNSKKYYQYKFPETYAQYGYGGFSRYRENPSCTVLLDEEGRIQEVTVRTCTINAGYTSFTNEQQYTIEITQYGDVELDFPELKEEDYPTLEERAAAEE